MTQGARAAKACDYAFEAGTVVLDVVSPDQVETQEYAHNPHRNDGEIVYPLIPGEQGNDGADHICNAERNHNAVKRRASSLLRN